MTRGSRGATGRRLQLHGGVAEKDPRAANIRISNTKLGAEDAFTERRGRISSEYAQQGLVQGALRRRTGETGRGPDANRSAVWREEQGFGKTLGIDVVEKSV